MKNPLPVAHWLLIQDAQLGLLEEGGFDRKPHPECDGVIYSYEDFHCHASGFWLDHAGFRLLYSRPGKRFYRTRGDAFPHNVPADAERVPLQEGFEAVMPALRRHEEWIAQRCGSDFRTKLLNKLPSQEKRYAKNWKLHFSECLRKRAVTT